MTFSKMTDYIRKTEQDAQFVKDEMMRLKKSLPDFAEVVIDERNEYLTQSILQIAHCHTLMNQMERNSYGLIGPSRGKIVAVVGAGHLEGILKHLKQGINV